MLWQQGCFCVDVIVGGSSNREHLLTLVWSGVCGV